MTLDASDLTDDGEPSKKDIAGGYRAALLLLAVLTIFRIVYGAQLGMAEDEMHYWQWSRHLAASYYDQGPGIAYVIRLGTTLLGNTPLGIRLPNILLGAGTGWFVYLTTLHWTKSTQIALWALVLLNVAPLIAAGSVLATYDGPQVFFWSAALYALTRTLETDRTAGWYLVGLLTGLGLLCKLTMLLFAPGVLIFLLWAPRYRRHLSMPHPYLAFVITLLMFVPIVQWNATHGWMGFLHTVALGSRRQDAAPFRWFGDFLGGQAIALGPMLFLAELYALFRLARAPRTLGITDDAGKFLVAFGAPTIVLCLVVSLKSKMEINWPAPAHLTGLAAVAVWLAYIWCQGDPKKRAAVVASVCFSLMLTLVAFFPGVLTWFGKPISASTAQKLNETYGWTEIASPVQSARLELEREGKPVFVAGINYRVDSALAFYLPDQPQTEALYLNSRRDEYVIWTHPEDLIGQNAILCLDEDDDPAVELARGIFASVTLLPPINVYRPGFAGPVKHWNIYDCRDFKGYDPNASFKGY